MIAFTEMAIKTMTGNLKVADLRSSMGINKKYICIVTVHISRLPMMQFQKILLFKKNSTNIFTILKLGTEIFPNISLGKIYSSLDIFPLLKPCFHQNNRIVYLNHFY